MILKFRDAHIAKLEKTQKKNDLVVTADERDKEVVRSISIRLSYAWLHGPTLRGRDEKGMLKYDA